MPGRRQCQCLHGRVSVVGEIEQMQFCLTTACLGLMLALLLRVGIAGAEEIPPPRGSDVAAAADSGAGPEDRPNTNTPTGLFGGSIGERSEVPVDLRPFQIALPREHLVGDWFGVRPKLEAQGIIPTLALVSDIAGNVSGGRNQGLTHADNLGLDLLFDLCLGRWRLGCSDPMSLNGKRDCSGKQGCGRNR